MAERLQELTNKIEEVLNRLEQYRTENIALKAENSEHKHQVIAVKKEYAAIVLEGNDRTEVFKTKLAAVLQRLDELEALTK